MNKRNRTSLTSHLTLSLEVLAFAMISTVPTLSNAQNVEMVSIAPESIVDETPKEVIRSSKWLDVSSSKNYKIPMKSKTRDDIIEFSKTAWGSRYILGGSNWNAQNRKAGGVDCAGLVLKSFGWPVVEDTKTSMSPSYIVDGKHVPGKLHTSQFAYEVFPWTVNSKYSYDDLEVGDALTYYKGGKTGHTLLVYKKTSASKGVIASSEARSSKMGVGTFTRSMADLKATKYRLNKPNFIIKAAQAPENSQPQVSEPIVTSPIENPILEPVTPVVVEVSTPPSPPVVAPVVTPAPEVKPVKKVTKTPPKKVKQKPKQIYYTSKSGDTRASIAAKFGVSKSHITQLNPNQHWLIIKAGTRLRIK